MPWTLSHTAAVLPLRRLTPWPLDFPALVIGSMTPDMGYYIDRFELAAFAHTLAGSFVACLPVGLVMFFIFYLFARPVCYTLPWPHRQLLLPLCPQLPKGLSGWLVVLCSLLLGAWTHNFWDAFTHEHGWFVDRIPALQQPVMRLGSTTIQMFLFLQELSTIVGFVIVTLAYCIWLRKSSRALAAEATHEGWRYFFWVGVIGISFAIAIPIGVRYAMSTPLHGFLFFRSIVFNTAIYSSAIALPLLLIGATVAYRRRPALESARTHSTKPIS